MLTGSLTDIFCNMCLALNHISNNCQNDSNSKISCWLVTFGKTLTDIVEIWRPLTDWTWQDEEKTSKLMALKVAGRYKHWRILKLNFLFRLQFLFDTAISLKYPLSTLSTKLARIKCYSSLPNIRPSQNCQPHGIFAK